MLTPPILGHCMRRTSEFLVHAADVEGLCRGIDQELVQGNASLGSCARHFRTKHYAVITVSPALCVAQRWAIGARCRARTLAAPHVSTMRTLWLRRSLTASTHAGVPAHPHVWRVLAIADLATVDAITHGKVDLTFGRCDAALLVPVAHTDAQRLTGSRPCDRAPTLCAQRAGHIRRQNRPLC